MKSQKMEKNWGNLNEFGDYSEQIKNNLNEIENKSDKI